MAGWLALTEEEIFEALRDNEPAALIEEGDPESLAQWQRNQVLHAYVQHYGSGGWQGRSVPQIQAHRLASPKLADDIVPTTLTVPTFNSFNSRAISKTCKNASLTASMFCRRNAQIVS